MAQARAQKKKIKWADTLIALVLASFGIYFLVAGFNLQSKESGLITAIISYIIGLALLMGAKMFKQKALSAE